MLNIALVNEKARLIRGGSVIEIMQSGLISKASQGGLAPTIS